MITQEEIDADLAFIQETWDEYNEAYSESPLGHVTDAMRTIQATLNILIPALRAKINQKKVQERNQSK